MIFIIGMNTIIHLINKVINRQAKTEPSVEGDPEANIEESSLEHTERGTTGEVKNIDKSEISDSDINLVLDKVQDALVQITKGKVVSKESITMEQSLIDDYGLTSLDLVDLTFALEENLALPIFPLQKWLDEETEKTSDRFTIRSLVYTCADLIK